MLDAGYLSPTEIQAKTISRILGGKHIIAVAPSGSGKTTACVFSVLMRLKGHQNGAPRALIVVPDRDKVTALAKLFNWHGKSTGLRIGTLTAGITGEQHMEAIEDGLVDIVIGTPDKINALYVKSLLNLRSLTMLVLDDAETLVKLNQQATVYNLAEGLTKCQRIVLAEVVSDKLSRLTDHLMPVAEFIEIQEKEPEPNIIPMILYKVSNFKTKLNLLELILRDSTTFSKVVVFVNTKSVADTLFNNLKKRLGKSITRLNNGGIDSLEIFKDASESRVIVLSGEDQPSFNLLSIPYIFHMEIPSKEIFIKRIKELNSEEKAVSISFATNPEEELVKKIEQTTGQKMKQEKLPDELVIDVNPKKSGSADLEKSSKKTSPKNEDWDWKIN